MNREIERLKGRGRLVGPGIDTDVSYALSVTTEMVGVGHLGDPTAAIEGLKTIRGRVDSSNPVHPPLAEKLTLTLKDGRKLLIFMQSDGEVIATGGFF